MSEAATLTVPTVGLTHIAEEQLGYWEDVRRRFFRNRTAVLGLILFGALLAIALIGPLVFRSDYTSARNGLELQRPGSDAGLLGTDSLGRNIAHRVVRGLGISLRLAAAVAIGTTTLGMILGGLAGYLGGRVDNIISRFIDAMYAIPYILIGFAAIAIFGSGFLTVFGSLLVTGWLQTARIFRSSVLQIRNQEYIEAARATGAKTKRIMLNHVLPNALPPLLVAFAFAVAGAILAETIYSFLGIGFIEPTPSIGVMIRDARTNFQVYPHLLLIPASVLILLTLSIIFIGDGLRDALDPKLRGVD